jgi:hypothetical protein
MTARHTIPTRQLQQGIEDGRQAESRLRWDRSFGRVQRLGLESGRGPGRDPGLVDGPKVVGGDSDL